MPRYDILPGKNLQVMSLISKKPVSFRLQNGKNSTLDCLAKFDFGLKDFEISHLHSRKDNRFIYGMSARLQEPSWLFPRICPHHEAVLYILKRCMETAMPLEKFLTLQVGLPNDLQTKWFQETPCPIWGLKSTDPVVLTVTAQLHDQVCKRLEHWVDARFGIEANFNPLVSHPFADESKQLITRCYNKLKTETVGNWATENILGVDFNAFRPVWPNSDYQGMLTGRLTVHICILDMKPNLLLPDYFIKPSINERFSSAHKQLEVKGEYGGCFQVNAEALRASSEVINTLMETRWEGDLLTQITIPGLSGEGVDALRDFLECSHIQRATNNFPVAVELLIMANAYAFTNLEDKLLDLMYVQPLNNFTEAESLVSLFVFLVNTRASEQVLERVSGVVKLNANVILDSEMYPLLDATEKKLLDECISTYDVTFDTMSSWFDCHECMWEMSKFCYLFRSVEEILREQPNYFNSLRLVCDSQLWGISLS